ncbi:MAG TPA: metallophosphoesterase [Fimbriimonadaceae bacterium]|nr:metallophosphoesterase [Fimbriimonadaceae bacterium]
MKIAHISDTHLGYYAYGKTAQGRMNQREVDVCATFRRCLDAIAARDPDLVIHSGDFFHVVRPSNYSLIAGYKMLAQFQHKRMGKPFVIIGGNHDTPQSAESANILDLFRDIEGVSVETGSAVVVETAAAGVLCVSHKSLASGENVSWAPPSSTGTKILAVHGILDTIQQQTKVESFDFALGDARPDEWDYIALGDWHVHQTFGPNICYAGSTDFTSTSIWEEASRAKGWVWFDTDVREIEFVPVQTRRVIDLAPIDALDLTAEQLGAKLIENANWKDEEMPIVRQRVLNVHAETRRELPLSIVRDLQARALYYRPDLRPPAAISATGDSEGRAASLESCWQTHIDASPFPAEIDKPKLRQLGLDLLQEVAEYETAPAEA